MKSKNWLLLKNLTLTEHKTKRDIPLKEFLRQINLNQEKLKKIYGFLHGNFQSIVHGIGYDFNEIREYKIGDDLRHISWNATAKTNTLQTKEYFAEKELSSFFLIDISNSMFCGNKTEPFIQLFAFMLNLSCSFSEKIGGLLFTDDIKYYFPLKASTPQANIIFQTFLNYFNNISKENPSNPQITDFSKALEFANKAFTKKGLVFIISDFLNLLHWEKTIYETAQKQNIYSFQIYDHIDFILPQSGYISLLDPETKQYFLVNTDSKAVQKKYKMLMNQKQDNLKSFLKSSGINHMVVEKNDFV